ncbi:MAG TPA: transposase [Solirubrobacteraceae bacterium]|nr:transposase [Solirubrobacteraceae bacterium]
MIAELDASRWTGRPGYPIRSMVGIALAKSLYAIPTWTKVVALVKEHENLSEVIAPDGDIPSVFACYRFTKKLIDNKDMVDKCIESHLSSLREKNPDIGKNVAIDASDMPAYANGQKYVSNGGRERDIKEYSDPDASWGHRSAVSTRKGGGFYGYRLHAAVCADTELPLAWKVSTAKSHEVNHVEDLLNTSKKRGFEISTCILDKGYDTVSMHSLCIDRDIDPIIPLKNTPAVAKGGGNPPACEHGEWSFAGADRKRGATKWRCPTGECATKSTWISTDRLHSLIPRTTERWKALYKKRSAVERVFGRLKHQWSLLPLRIRGIEKVQLHADLTILTKLSCALLKA